MLEALTLAERLFKALALFHPTNEAGCCVCKNMLTKDSDIHYVRQRTKSERDFDTVFWQIMERRLVYEFVTNVF